MIYEPFDVHFKRASQTGREYHKIELERKAVSSGQIPVEYRCFGYSYKTGSRSSVNTLANEVQIQWLDDRASCVSNESYCTTEHSSPLTSEASSRPVLVHLSFGIDHRLL